MQKIDYRLGLDLGTNSIGWAVYSLDKENHPENLVDIGVRIFSDGRNPKTKEPLAVERRTARGARKLIYRRKLRRRATFKLLQEQGLFPKTKEDASELKRLNPYELRVKALDEKLEPFELARVLFNLSVRRGFKSNRKDGSREENSKNENSKSEKLTQSDMQGNLQNAIKNSGFRTLGEFLWKNKDENGGLRFVPGRMNYYPLRQMYIDEFNAIKRTQEKYFSNIDWQKIYNSIFDQRPLKSPERGSCQYMSDKKRTWKAMPCSEKLRVLQEVRNLNYDDENGKTFPISEEQEKIILNLLYTKESVKFDAFRKALHLNGKCTFNLERNRTELKGSPTSVKMRNEKRFGKLWDTLTLEKQDDIVEKLFEAEEDSEILEMLSEFDLTDEQKKAVSNLVLPSGTAMLCREVSEQLVHKMQTPEMPISYATAVQMLGYKYADQFVEKFDELPYYGKVLVGSTMGGDLSKSEDNPEQKYGKISNPTVHVALNQTKTVVNALIKEYGKPTQIVVELSRDLKASREAKADMIKRQNENTKRNEILNKNISAAFPIPYPSRKDRLKYRLWEELGAEGLSRKCLYCGKTISATEIFTKNIEIEHILPFGRTLCDAESNKTVAHASCNAFKGELSPFEAFGSNPDGYDWTEILLRANALKNPAKRARFSEKAMETFEKESGFIQRQLTDNAYLSKTAKKYLTCLVEKDSNVWTVSGGMTKLLRDKWDIDSILKRKIGDKEIAHFELKDDQIGSYKKNRYDHRHHALDASIIALIDRSMVQEISRLNQIHRKNRIDVPQMPVLREELIEKVKNIVPSHKPDHGIQGKLSKETLLGKINREGKEVFVARCPLISLSEKNISDIVDVAIQKKLNGFVAENKGKKFEEILQEFSKQTGIKKVRCVNRVQTPIEIKGDVPRYLAPEDYFAAIVWEIPPKKPGAKPTYEAQYIRRDEVDADGKPKNSEKPHSAAKNLGTVHKGDYLEFSDNGKWYKCRVAGYSATQNKFDIRPVCAVTDCNDWLISTADNMTESCWKTTKGQNHVSVNVLFGEKQARFITVNPIGRVFRKK